MTLKNRLKYIKFETWLDCFIYNNKYILYLRRNLRNVSILILLVTSPYLIVNWFLRRLYAATIGKFLVAYKLSKEKNQKFLHEIAIVAIAKQEGLYIEEWIEYHKLIGISKIYLYDNDSSDNTYDIIKKYIKSGFIDYTPIHGGGKQLTAYNDAINKHKSECRFMAFIDLDEYIMLSNPSSTITETLAEMTRHRINAAGVALNWCMYGNSGHKKRPVGLIIENYLDRATNTNPMNHMIKTICNPRMVKDYISPHYPLYLLGAISVDSTGRNKSKGWFCRDLTFHNMRLNHYYCKSEEDFALKVSRGLGDRNGKYDLSKFHQMNFNEVHDESMLIYAAELNRAMDKSL